MNQANPKPMYPGRPFGRRLRPPLSAEQRAEAQRAEREAERLAQMARFQAYADERAVADAASFEAMMRQANAAVAGYRLRGLGRGLPLSILSFIIGFKAGRRS